MNERGVSRMAMVLEQVVREAGDRLRRRLSRPHRIQYKSEKNLVTEMDCEVEALFFKTVGRYFPGHKLLSEESFEAGDMAPAGKGIVRWIVDPLDGTTNYAHGFPHFAVSAGLECEGRIFMGAVYNPMLDEMFFARLGKGARRNGARIRVSPTRTLSESLLATGFPYDLRTSAENNFSNFRLFSRTAQAVRRPGSAALDLCDVACGRFDGFWEFALKPWDIAAGSLMVREAGGRITNFGFAGAAETLDLFHGSVLASNGKLHARMLRVLGAGGRGRRRRGAAKLKGGGQA